MKVGYIGLGAMGSSLAHWLIKEHELWVWDLNPDAMAQLAAQGANAAESLASLAHACDVIFLCLPRSQNVEQAIFGEGGLFAGLSAGKILIDQTSGVGAATQEMAQRLDKIGVRMLDAPVAGGVPSAKAGTITIMVSGPDSAQAEAMPLFKAMTSKIYRASDQTGDAQSVKTLNNMMNMVFRVATLELAALCVRLGGSLAELTDTLNAGPAGNFTCRTVLPAILNDRSTGDFFLTLMLKDCNQALTLGMSENVPMPLSALARGVLQQNINLVGPMAKLDDVIDFMAQACGADYKATVERLTPENLMAQIETVLSACNRAIVYEIFALARKLNMELDDLGMILNNGSAWSQACEVILAELSGSSEPAPLSIGDCVAAMRQLELLNMYEGVATVMLGEVRALYETAQRELGAEASVTELAKLYQRHAEIHF